MKLGQNVPDRVVAWPTVPDPTASPPAAEQRPHLRRIHGTEVQDPWFWLRDREDPATHAHLQAENEFTETMLDGLTDLRSTLYDEIKARVQETDQSVPVRKGPWRYGVRSVEGQQYPIHIREPIDSDPGTAEEVLLDENLEAAGHDYFAVGDLTVSPDHRLLAYTVDTTGDEEYSLKVKALATGEIIDAGLHQLSYGLSWAADNTTLFAVRTDHAQRPDRVIRHTVGSPAKDDVTVFHEPDERFWVGVGLTRSEEFIVIGVEAKNTSEVWLIDAHSPTDSPRVTEPREEGIEYRIAHHDDRFLIVTNFEAEDFRLMQTPTATPGRDNWLEVIAHRPGIRLEDIDVFADFMVVSERRNAVPVMRIVYHDSDRRPLEIAMPEEVHESGPGSNVEYQSATFRFGYTSMVTPPSVFELDVATGERSLLKQQPVLGDFDADVYETRRVWATAPDGTQVPISLVWRPDRTDLPAPCLLYGYGSYEMVMPASFSSARLSLLDRGIVFAIAHVRGGGELGRAWYDKGRLEHKANTFGDFIACAEHLIETGWAKPDGMVARGGSAGGLLMGVIANERPDLFAGIVAEVPFVDNVNTMLDASIPLTVTEYDEWGNPNDADDYGWMRAYSPYENVSAQPYPAILVTAGLNDPRVQYWEPAKWVAKLRAHAVTGGPILLKTEMGAGHGGPSGRYDAWRDEAFVLSFILDAMDLHPEP